MLQEQYAIWQQSNEVGFLGNILEMILIYSTLPVWDKNKNCAYCYMEKKKDNKNRKSTKISHLSCCILK